jgi:hypothetical protein
MNLDDFTPEELIARFIIESRNQGHFLAYEDHDIVKNWVNEARGDTDRLLLILSDILPRYFEKSKGASARLTGINRSVLSKLKTN